MNDQLALPSLAIAGFRSFRKLEIPTLGHVNLIVGRNNVGKTSLLEALRLYATRGYPPVLGEILESRDELRASNDDELRVFSPSSEQMLAVQYLFFGYPRFTDRDASISIGPIGEEALKVAMHWYKEEVGPDGMSRLTEVFPDKALFEKATSFEGAVPALQINYADIRRVIRVNQRARDLRRRLMFRGEAVDYRCVCVGPKGPDLLNPTGQLWDHIALTESEKDVIHGLQLLAPEIERISLVGDPEERQERIAVVKIKGRLQPLPLHNLGDGVNRVFQIVLALVNAKNGFLLIDEIENGLHYSIQSGLWRLILAVARTLDVQVFATSHSWDCISAFQEACQGDSGGDGAVIRLSRVNEDVVARIFNKDDLAIVTRDQIEVR